MFKSCLEHFLFSFYVQIWKWKMADDMDCQPAWVGGQPQISFGVPKEPQVHSWGVQVVKVKDEEDNDVTEVQIEREPRATKTMKKMEFEKLGLALEQESRKYLDRQGGEWTGTAAQHVLIQLQTDFICRAWMCGDCGAFTNASLQCESKGCEKRSLWQMRKQCETKGCKHWIQCEKGTIGPFRNEHDGRFMCIYCLINE
jgi:hypothetical protein